MEDETAVRSIAEEKLDRLGMLPDGTYTGRSTGGSTSVTTKSVRGRTGPTVQDDEDGTRSCLSTTGQLYTDMACHINTMVTSEVFQNVILAFIVLAGALVGVSTYDGMEDQMVIIVLDTTVLYIFLVECILKIIAEGLTPWKYFTGGEWQWNTFDCTIVALCFLPFAEQAIFLRLLRLSRLFKLVKRIPQLRVIVMGLVGGMKSIAYIMILIFIVFYLYAIVGMLAFKKNDPTHFGSLPITLLSLLRMATLEDWTDIMYINIFDCQHYGYEDPRESVKCVEPHKNVVISVLYFVSFVFVSALVMLSLFIGVITHSMQVATDKMREEQAEQRKEMQTLKGMKQLQKQANLDLLCMVVEAWNGHEAAMSFLASKEQGEGKPWLIKKYITLSVRTKLFVESMIFQKVILLVIVMASVLVGVEMDLDVIPVQLETTVLVIFTLEIFVKIVAEGLEPWNFLNSGWNRLDFLSVLMCFLPIGGSYMYALRVLRVLRVLKLVNTLPQLQIIIQGLMMGVSSIGFIALLLFMVFYMFAIIAMILFKANDPWHFGQLHIAILTLFRCATGEDWTDVMYINMYGCDEYGYHDKNGVVPEGEGLDGAEYAGECTDPQPSGFVAAMYFTVFILIASLVMLNLFVGVVTTGMEESSKAKKEEAEMMKAVHEKQLEYGLTNKELAKIHKVFLLFDIDNSGQISAEEMETVLVQIGDRAPDATNIFDMVAMVDDNGDGEISYLEFISFMQTFKQQEDLEKSIKDGSFRADQAKPPPAQGPEGSDVSQET